MPQTEEHLDIVHTGHMAIFVITKADLVPPARIAEVEKKHPDSRHDPGKLAEDGSPSVTGDGIDELKQRIGQI
jgi:selenocysteine-specific translation elongation factor